MYAVIKTGGKQYRVKSGDVLEVEHLAPKGDRVTFTPVLVSTDEGQTVYGASELKSYPVTARILGDAKGDKVTVFKYRPKSGYAAKRGHRQLYSLIEILSIGEHAAPAVEDAEAGAAPAEEAQGAEPAAAAGEPSEATP